MPWPGKVAVTRVVGERSHPLANVPWPSLGRRFGQAHLHSIYCNQKIAALSAYLNLNI